MVSNKQWRGCWCLHSHSRKECLAKGCHWLCETTTTDGNISHVDALEYIEAWIAEFCKGDDSVPRGLGIVEELVSRSLHPVFKEKKVNPELTLHRWRVSFTAETQPWSQWAECIAPLNPKDHDPRLEYEHWKVVGV